MSTTFHAQDPDAAVTYPITDGEGGNVDWADPTVLANGSPIAATWEGVPAPERDITVPLGALAVGVYDLWLVVPGGTDIHLGIVSIMEGVAGVSDVECLWPLDPGCLNEEWAAADADVQMRSHMYATATLRRLTVGRIGVCPITIRPNPKTNSCWTEPWAYGDSGFMRPMNYAGEWTNCAPCAPGGCEVNLPPPVGRIDEVKVDGTVLPASDYRLLNGRTLVYQGAGECPWPRSQDVSKPDTEEGTFSITYLNAAPVDALASHAAGVLAVEFAKACSGDKKCRLPDAVTTIVRQGVTLQRVSGAFVDGLTNIKEVDAFVALWNPRRVKEAPSVWWPGMNDRFAVESS